MWKRILGGGLTFADRMEKDGLNSLRYALVEKRKRKVFVPVERVDKVDFGGGGECSYAFCQCIIILCSKCIIKTCPKQQKMSNHINVPNAPLLLPVI